TVQRDRMSHGYVLADVDAVLAFHAVEHAAVLDIRVCADADLADISAHDGAHPDGGMLAEHDITDNLRRVVDVAGGGDGGAYAFIGSNHGSSVTVRRKTLTITRGVEFDKEASRGAVSRC